MFPSLFDYPQLTKRYILDPTTVVEAPYTRDTYKHWFPEPEWICPRLTTSREGTSPEVLRQ